MRKRYRTPSLQGIYETMFRLAHDPTSELYHEGGQRSGAGHRAAFWDGYNGVKHTPHVIPGTPSAACARAGQDFRAEQAKTGAAVVRCDSRTIKRVRPSRET
jgi:hypothetical protein